MKELFLVSRENPSASELDVVVFTAKSKAVKKFKEYWEEATLENVEGSDIEIKKDDENEKEYFHYDGTHTDIFIVQLKKIKIGEEFSMF